MRTVVRECIYKLIFAYLFTGTWDDFLKTTVFQEAKLNEQGIAFAEQLLSSLKLHIEQIREEISGYAIGFDKRRIFKADLCAMILAVTEFRYVGGIDTAITIDQAVSLSAKYSAENSPNYVNGILAAYIKDHPELYVGGDKQ